MRIDTLNRSDEEVFQQCVLQHCNRPNINIIQIGANDGSDSNHMIDPVRQLIKSNKRVFACLVEPQLVEFQRLIKNYESDMDRVQFLNVAIANEDKKVKLYKNIDVAGTSGHSSLLLRQNEMNTMFSEDSYELVDGITVFTLLQKCTYDQIDVLAIDAEGSDMMIIEQFLALSVWPTILYFEKPYPQEGNDRLNQYASGYAKLTELSAKLADIGYIIATLSGNILCIKDA